MQLDEYTALDAVGLAALIRAGEVTAQEVCTVAREAIGRADEVVNGLAHPVFDEPLAYDPAGPFAGVPFLLKDVPMARGVPFSVGSRAIPDIPAERDHDLMTRFRAAGLATLGSTSMCELGLSFATEPLRTGPTRNPFDPSRGAGGSSGGAAALVAAGAVPVAHANDGAGSIRVPASCCGLVGLKPSRGRVPCGPDTGEGAFGLAYEFALTRTVRDAAHLLDAVHGPAVGDKYTAPPPRRPYRDELGTDPGRLRVALMTQAWSGAPVDPQVAAATVRAGRLLERLGHVVEPGGPDLDWQDVLAGVRGEAIANAAPLLLAPRQPDPAKLEGVTRRVLEEVRAATALDLVRAFAAHNRVTRAMGRFMQTADVLVTPTIAQPPAPHGALDYDNDGYTVDGWLRKLFEYGPFTAVFNISGQPAISLPLGRTSTGLPIGVQLVAGYGREDLLLALAAALEGEFMTYPTGFIGKSSRNIDGHTDVMI
jgi:amidase